MVERPDDEDVESELIPEDAEVEREETLLLVVDRPVDEDVESELMPDDAEVDSEPA